jgi:dTDP-4-dehydrorhamnose 3,5-epimerase
MDGLFIGKRNPISNGLGDLTRFYCNEELKKIGINSSICQINKTLTNKIGSIRGMHFQLYPYQEDKIVSCLKGIIFDVAIDIRRNSSTFLNYHAEILSEKNNKFMCIPKGFAHGFQSLSDCCEVLYFHTEFYSSKFERGIRWDDKSININWPLAPSKISERDMKHKIITKEFQGI